MARPASARTDRHEGAAVAEPGSSFVGRTRDLAAIDLRFDEGARLVTILAPGGMGKTRLALRYAATARAGFEAHGGSVHVVDLTSTTDVAGLQRALASAIGAPLEKSRSEEVVSRSLGRAIARRKRILLVLDNLESVAKAAAPTIAAWMSGAPDARWLVTSRVMAEVEGEHLVPLEPLEVPGLGMTAAEVVGVPAVDLFLKRARAVSPKIGSGAHDLTRIAEIVRRVDGIPLAIELAAARCSVLDLGQLEAKLSAPLDVLVRRDAEGRHASMRRAIVDSLEVLRPSYRLALARASMFRGRFDLQACEAVLGLQDTLGALDALVSASLVRIVDAPNRRHFALFEAIREVSSEELGRDPRDLGETRERHVSYFADLARTMEARIDEGESKDSREALTANIDNLIAAHRGALSTRDSAELALDLALGAGLVLVPRGDLALHFELLDSALAELVAHRLGEWDLRIARAFVARGIARRELGDVDGARTDLEVGRAHAKGDPHVTALSLLWLVISSKGSETQRSPSDTFTKPSRR